MGDKPAGTRPQALLFICLPGWVLVRLACLPLPFICLPLLFICLPVLFICLPGWVGNKLKEVGDKPATNPTTSNQPGRQIKRTGRQMKGSGRQASREPDHKHPAWETNEKNWETNEKKWETNERKWETSQLGTRPQAPSLGDK